MTIADALNILAHIDEYAKYNLADPRFSDTSDGQVRVAFMPARADKACWGLLDFASTSDLKTYMTGMDAARREAAYDAAKAAATPATAAE